MSVALPGVNDIGERHSTLTHNSNASHLSNTRSSRVKALRIPKAVLCDQLKKMEKSNSPSPSRISRLYAMLQSSDKGVNRLNRKHSKNYFNENIRMSRD